MPLPPILIGAASGLAGSIAAYKYKAHKKKNAEIRKAEITKWRKLRRKFHHRRSSQDFPGKGKPDPEFRTQDSPALEVTDGSGETVLSIAKVPDPDLAKWEEVRGDKGKKSQLSRLNPLLSAVPNLGVAGHVGTTNYAMVSVPLEILSKSSVSENGLRAIVRDGGGKIKEHAELFKPELLTGMVSIGAIWTIASVALAQKHLHDISGKLDTISKQLEGIGRFQKEERLSKIEGTLREFMQMKREMSDYNFDHIPADAVASECIQLSKIQSHIVRDVSRAIEELDNMDGLGPEFDDKIKSVVTLLNEFGLCVIAKLHGYQIMAVRSENTGWLDGRLDDLEGDIESLTGHHDSTVDAVLDKLAKDRHSPDSLRLLADLRSSGELESIVGSVEEERDKTRECVWSRHEPVSVLLKVSGGEIEGFALAEG